MLQEVFLSVEFSSRRSMISTSLYIRTMRSTLIRKDFQSWSRRRTVNKVCSPFKDNYKIVTLFIFLIMRLSSIIIIFLAIDKFKEKFFDVIFLPIVDGAFVVGKKMRK